MFYIVIDPADFVKFENATTKICIVCDIHELKKEELYLTLLQSQYIFTARHVLLL